MTITTIMAKDDGTVIKESVLEYQTERNWNKKLFKLRRNAAGTVFTWRLPSGMSNAEIRFFSDEEVLPMTEREIERYKNRIRSERREADKNRRERKKLEKQREFDNSKHTAWQWLEHFSRIPCDNASPVKKGDWWYYYGRDTREVDKGCYDKLKEQYVERYGGWEHIDLDNTEYDGRRWW